jgi:hypothetical protein
MIGRTIIKLIINTYRLYSTINSLPPRSINSNNIITSDNINALLVNQEVSISQKELDKLLEIKGVSFELPLSDQTYPAYLSLIGRPKTKGRRAGVYIFTHIVSGSKYVGSSNSLSRRLEQYFNPNSEFNKYGLLLPLLKKEGFAAFKLEIFVMPKELSKNYYFLFLEQYYLLKKEFNLNTQRIVNFRVNQGTSVYLYDKDSKILYHSTSSINGLNLDLGIHYTTITKCLKNGSLYLNYFKITNKHVIDATKANLSLVQLGNLIYEKRSLFLKDFSKVTSKAICIKEVVTGETYNFTSIASVVKYLESKGIKANRNKIASLLNTNKIYLGYNYYTI